MIKYTFSGLVIQCVSKLVNPEKVAFEDKVVCHNYDPFDGDCADEFLCRTWFFSPVTAQGLRRVKEYARLGFIICDTAAGNGPHDGVLTPMASCRMGKP